MSGRYLVRRIMLVPLTVFGASLLIFFVMRVIPGDVAEVILGSSGARFTREQTDQLREQLGTNDPLPVQYARWMSGVLRGDLGKSLVTGRPVAHELTGRMAITAELAVMAGVIATASGILLGVLSAASRNKPWAVGINVFGIIGLAVPGFWLGTLIVLLLVTQFNWLPQATYVPFVEDPGANLAQFIWPAVTLGVSSAAIMMRLTRSSMLEVLSQDYVRTAHAKGLKGRVVLYRHVLKNALLPIVTLLGVQVGFLLGGAVVIETVFNLAGVGRLLVEAVNTRDYPVVQAIVMYMSLIYVVVWVVVDILYGWIDPRIRFA